MDHTPRADEPSDADPADDGAGAEEHPRPPRRASGGGTVLGAAMLGLGEVIEPGKTKVEIEQVVHDDEPDDLPFRIDFGDLPELS